MNAEQSALVARAEAAALDVLRHNAHGPYHGLFRTAGWGYPEPYTRDLMIAAPGILLSGDKKLIAALRRAIESAAAHQSEHGSIPSMVHDRENRGASDTTPLFLLAVACMRRATGEEGFLAAAADRAMDWMDCQSPCDRIIVAQQPTSDWRDEQWVMGYGLFVNTVVYSYLRLMGRRKKADTLGQMMSKFAVEDEMVRRKAPRTGLAVRHRPYYALWSYKLYGSDRFDLLGNSLAILSGLAPPSRSREMVAWVEQYCRLLRRRGELGVNLPPNLFPYIHPEDPDWRARYASFNLPGMYHNGGIWPFICGFYVAALVAAGRQRLAEKKLLELTRVVTLAAQPNLEYGFNECLRAQDGKPHGQDWQTWTAAMYYYAAQCVRRNTTPFFDEMRRTPSSRGTD